KILVELIVPNYSPAAKKSADGLQELRANTLDFDIEKSKTEIKLDGNSYKYVTNLKIKVPRETNLRLDTYRDGVIRVQDVDGKFDVRSHNCDIHLNSVSGSGEVWSYNGNLTADFVEVANDQPLELETYNGSIDLRLPKDTQANLKYRSGSGKVLTDLEVELAKDPVQSVDENQIGFDKFLRGTLNGGGPELKLETEKGDIQFRRRMNETFSR
ncbi:MAG: DUF4097 family beta strand repeat-containing protein, partial [Planctomycetota bacterium]